MLKHDTGNNEKDVGYKGIATTGGERCGRSVVAVGVVRACVCLSLDVFRESIRRITMAVGSRQGCTVLYSDSVALLFGESNLRSMRLKFYLNFNLNESDFGVK